MRVLMIRAGRPVGIVVLGCAALLIVAWSSPSQAQPSTQQLVQQAVHNTDTVRTLTHRDRVVTVNGGETVTAVITGEEDEVLNREQDYESVTVNGRDPKGAQRHLHYTATVVFLNGHTYYRLSLDHNVWKKGAGMVFHDPFTGGMQRGRTVVSYPAGSQFAIVPGSDRTLTHLRAIVATAKQRARTDLWISHGAKPFVVREVRDYRATGNHNTLFVDTRFVSFNQQLVITPPATST